MEIVGCLHQELIQYLIQTSALSSQQSLTCSSEVESGNAELPEVQAKLSVFSFPLLSAKDVKCFESWPTWNLTDWETWLEPDNVLRGMVSRSHGTSLEMT